MVSFKKGKGYFTGNDWRSPKQKGLVLAGGRRGFVFARKRRQFLTLRTKPQKDEGDRKYRDAKGRELRLPKGIKKALVITGQWKKEISWQRGTKKFKSAQGRKKNELKKGYQEKGKKEGPMYAIPREVHHGGGVLGRLRTRVGQL